MGDAHLEGGCLPGLQLALIECGGLLNEGSFELPQLVEGGLLHKLNIVGESVADCVGDALSAADSHGGQQVTAMKHLLADLCQRVGDADCCE